MLLKEKKRNNQKKIKLRKMTPGEKNQFYAFSPVS